VDRWPGKNGAKPGDIGNIGFYDVDFEALPGMALTSTISPTTSCVGGWIIGPTGTASCSISARSASSTSKGKDRADLQGDDRPAAKSASRSTSRSTTKSQIDEYLRQYKGEGIQHVAMGARDIYDTVEAMRAQGVEFLDTPETYFDVIDARVPGHGEDVARLAKNKILIDADPETKQRKLHRAGPDAPRRAERRKIGALTHCSRSPACAAARFRSV
jgi:hypothetical protein